jgi:hypothetical protein
VLLEVFHRKDAKSAKFPLIFFAFLASWRFNLGDVGHQHPRGGLLHFRPSWKVVGRHKPKTVVPVAIVRIVPVSAAITAAWRYCPSENHPQRVASRT